MEIKESNLNVHIDDDNNLYIGEGPLDLSMLSKSLYNSDSVCTLVSLDLVKVYTCDNKIYLLPIQFNIPEKDISKYDIRNWEVIKNQLDVRNVIESQGKVINNTYKHSDTDNKLTRLVKDTLNETSGLRIGLLHLANIKKSTEQLRKVKSTVSANKVLSFIEDLGKSGLCEMNIELKIKDSNGDISKKNLTIGDIK